MNSRIPLILIAAAASILIGCETTPIDTDFRPPPPVIAHSKEELYKHFDKEVTISGMAAENYAEHVVAIVLDDGTRVLIPELKTWPKRAVGKRVSATGMLERVPAPTEPAVHPDDRFVLKGVRWQLGKPTTQP